LGLNVHCVVHATGSAGTQAGLLAGLEGTGSQTPVLGMGVRAAKEAQEARQGIALARYRAEDKRAMGAFFYFGSSAARQR